MVWFSYSRHHVSQTDFRIGPLGICLRSKKPPNDVSSFCHQKNNLDSICSIYQILLLLWDVNTGRYSFFRAMPRIAKVEVTLSERPNSNPSESARGAIGRLNSRKCRWAGRHSFEGVSSSALLPSIPPSTSDDMAASPRISDAQLAAINAAAVTREYNVKPHLGEHFRLWIGLEEGH